ncbi:MAG: serpin family protein [Candidatus Marinimicrobia bacterium]|nr:serpin family protein [Candidatus Neomarinimicrobiota bacterium]
MKRILLFLLLFLINCDHIISDNPSTAQFSIKSIPKKLINANNEFSLELFRKLNPHERDGNIFISPVSASFALGMTMNGADGKTFDEMKTILGYKDFDLETINKTYAALIEELVQSAQGVEFNLANSVWFRNDLSLQDEFIHLNQQYFNAQIAALDFSQPTACKNIVNQWVEEQTKNKIKNFTQEDDYNSIMLLINAIYFDALWKYQFNEQETKEEAFYHNHAGFVTCEMMRQKSQLNYSITPDYQAIELPYANENYAMVIIEPTGENVDDFIQALSPSTFSKIVNSFKKDSVNLFIPKLEIEYTKELSDILKEMGILEAFDPNRADFSKMFNDVTEGIYIKLVRQKSFIKLNEKGTEAAAATVVIMDLKGAHNHNDEEIFLTIDKPFVFFIIEKQSDSILFCGKIINPNL